MTKTVAVLGLGSIGLRHARNLLALNTSVVGFDPDPIRQEQLRLCGAQTAESRASALRGSDAAVIASPSRFHLEDLSACIAAGVHVFVEKPLAHRIDGLTECLDAAARSGLTVFAGLMLRWHPCVEWARAQLATASIGTVLWARAQFGSYLPAWRPSQDYRSGYAADPETGGVLFDLIHEFDLLYHLLGPFNVAAAVARRSGMLEMASEDIGDLVFRHFSGLQSTLHVDYLTVPAMRIVEIAGSSGRIWIDLNERQCRAIDSRGGIDAEVRMPGSYADDYLAEMREFLECVDGSAVPRCTGVEALTVLSGVIEARRLCGLPAVKVGKQ